MKKQNGVTMVELVIVIIIILTITTFSVYTGKEATDQATVTEVYVEMTSMKNAVNSVIIKKDLDEDFELKSGDQYDFKVSELAADAEEFKNAFGVEVDEADFDDAYIIIGMDDMEKYEQSKVREYYGIDSIKHSYIVNFEKGEVELLKTIKLANRNVRTFEQVRALIDDGDI